MVCLIDDVLVCCSTYKVHDKRFEAALIQNQLQSARVILSTKRKSSVQVLGQMIDDQGVRIRPLSNMPA